MHDIIHSGTVEALLFNFPQGKEKRAALTGDVAECGPHFSDTGENHRGGVWKWKRGEGVGRPAFNAIHS